MNRNSSFVVTDYDRVAKALHWSIAALVVMQFVLAKVAEETASKSHELALMMNHRSIGITILLLVLVRLGWRLYRGAPPPVPMPAWQRTASQVAHWSLYALLFLLPVSGWLTSSADAVHIEWFRLFTVPDLLSANDELAESIEEVHKTLAKVLLVIALLHVAAGLKHGFVDKDESLRRISSPVTIGMFVVIVVLGVIVLI